MQETQEAWVWPLGREDPLEEEMATRSSIPAWRIPQDREAWWAILEGVAESRTGLSDSARTIAHQQCYEQFR